ncbi:AraC family transcriptional regulator [Streptomyces acidiscabies]|uniref:AraC family transcriptional regulator n=1 Tax=Streptomyces acidiscabies TaxID=42234 RepID=UPI000951E661|nr:AraC family transcriptional regulator [Streptomyces acidiscabies]
MLKKVFDSEDLPASDRVEVWHDITARALVPNEILPDRSSEFAASLRTAGMGEAAVAALTYSSFRSRRTPRLIRRADPEMYAVGLILGGRQAIWQNRREAPLSVGGLVVYSTSRPYEAVVDARQSTGASVVVQVPRAVVALPPDRVERLLAVQLPGDEGLGRLLAGFLTHVATDTGPYRTADAHRLGGIGTDLITAWLAHHLDMEDQAPADTRQHVQFLEIQSFIHRHLGEAELSPATIAAAHHISLRTLHRVFQDHSHGATVASYIRDQRLARVRRDLADPRLSARPVHAVAARWGYPDAARFSRAFRNAYDSSPSEFRSRHVRNGTR